MQQQDIPEWLDTDSGTPEEISDALIDLRNINRRFGGLDTMQSMIEHVSRTKRAHSLTILEVAAGAGYVPETVRVNLEQHGIELKVTLLDRAFTHLPQQEDIRRDAVAADAMALPFAEDSFDIVDCSLFAHHLLPAELLRFVNEGLRVCRAAVLINDLIRSRLHLFSVYAALPLFRSRITRHDAIVSVQRAYTVAEMSALLAKSAAARVEIQRHFLFRMGVIAWKQ